MPTRSQERFLDRGDWFTTISEFIHQKCGSAPYWLRRAGVVSWLFLGIAVLTAYTLTTGLGWFGLPTERVVVDIDDPSVQSELFDVTEAGTEDSDEE